MGYNGHGTSRADHARLWTGQQPAHLGQFGASDPPTDTFLKNLEETWDTCAQGLILARWSCETETRTAAAPGFTLRRYTDFHLYPEYRAFG